ncbi:MAG: hypothetical protein IE913_05685, partial [Halothiobacillus sp.]|nr:hypothetical protein [Halothiobacillus sp.]
FVIMVPEEEVISLDMSVEEGFRMVISLGVVTPKSQVAKPVPATPELEKPSSSG